MFKTGQKPRLKKIWYFSVRRWTRYFISRLFCNVWAASKINNNSNKICHSFDDILGFLLSIKIPGKSCWTYGNACFKNLSGFGKYSKWNLLRFKILLSDLTIKSLFFSGLGFQDIMARQGLVDQSLKPPFILGFECAGEVEALGDGVVDIQVRKKVFFAFFIFILQRVRTKNKIN